MYQSSPSVSNLNNLKKLTYFTVLLLNKTRVYFPKIKFHFLITKMTSQLKAIFDDFLWKVNKLYEEVFRTGNSNKRNRRLSSQLSNNQEKRRRIQKNNNIYSQGHSIEFLKNYDNQENHNIWNNRYLNHKDQFKKNKLNEHRPDQSRRKHTKNEYHSKESLSFLKGKAEYYGSRIRAKEWNIRQRNIRDFDANSSSKWSNVCYGRPLKYNRSGTTTVSYSSINDYKL